ncbi:MAG TPA: hypothetical protein VGN28_05545 [Blastococcus sp.]|jgi:vacuolar-type H+-ATPase subunit H|nr:hypothetical protein [Blastococcus sp.]
MPSARELLQRFRPVGTPGAAAPAGVPADRATELSRELQPVFDELATTTEEVGRIRAAAAEQARVRRDGAAEEARRIVQTARLQAEAERADTAARILRRAEQETATAMADASRQAADITGRARARSAGYIQRIVDEVGRAGVAS